MELLTPILTMVLCVCLGLLVSTTEVKIPHKFLLLVPKTEIHRLLKSYKPETFALFNSRDTSGRIFSLPGSPEKVLQHTLGHQDCPACEAKRAEPMVGRISGEMCFREAAKIFAESKEFNAPGARYVSPRTLDGYEEFQKPLNRFFADLRLSQIHHGHLRTYQEQRASGKLGPSDEEWFLKVCKWDKLPIEEARSNPVMRDYVQKRIARLKHEEVGAAKINQELAFLIRVMRRAQCWTPELEEFYQPLQVTESDVPKALTPEEQRKWLDVSASRERWWIVHYYSVLAFDTTATQVELRNLRLGDINQRAWTISVRAATAKNKYRIRTIDLNPDSVIAVQWLLSRADELGSKLATDFLFPARVHSEEWNPSEPMGPTGIRRPWEEVETASGITLTPHGCRHTAITRYAEAGVPISIIQARAGHISPRMTQHYIAISSAAQRWASMAVYRGEMYPSAKPVQNDGKSLNSQAYKKA